MNRHNTAVDTAIVLGLIVLSVAIRLGQINDSLWLDELHTAWTVRGSLAELPARAHMGNNGSLYFYLPFTMTRWFGWSEWSLRMPSLVASLGSVVAMFVVLRKWQTNRVVATIAALLVAVDANNLFYSIEARTYALVQLAGLLQIVCFVEWLVPLDQRQPNRKVVFFYILLSLVLIYLHMTAGLLIAVQVILLATLPLLGAPRPRRWWAVAMVIALGTLPVAWLASRVFTHRVAWSFVKIPSVNDLVDVFPIAEHCGLVVVALIGAAVLRIVFGRSNPLECEATHGDAAVTVRQHRMMLGIAACFGLTLILAWMLTRFDFARLFYRRYLMEVSLLPMLFVGMLLSRLGANARLAVGVATLLVVLATGPVKTWNQQGVLISRSHEDWRSAVGELVLRQPDLVIVDSRLIECDRLSKDSTTEFREYCSLPLRGIYPLDSDVEIVPVRRTHPEIDVEAILRRHDVQNPWLISRSRQDWSQRLDELSIPHDPVQKYGGVSIVRLKVGR